MEELKKNFCEFLRKYKEEQPHGAMIEVAQKTGISQNTLTHIVSLRSASTEGNRRKIAAAIGVPYDQMLGLKNDDDSMEAVSIVEYEKLKDELYKLQQWQKAISFELEQKEEELADKKRSLEYAYQGMDAAKETISMQKRLIEAQEKEIEVLKNKRSDK